MIIPVLDYFFFLEASTEVRIQRIKERESQRFGTKIEPGGVSRTRKLHEDWLTRNSVSCKKILTDQSQVNVMNEY
jgi:hypothetical protein